MRLFSLGKSITFAKFKGLLQEARPDFYEKFFSKDAMNFFGHRMSHFYQSVRVVELQMTEEQRKGREHGFIAYELRTKPSVVDGRTFKGSTRYFSVEDFQVLWINDTHILPPQ